MAARSQRARANAFADAARRADAADDVLHDARAAPAARRAAAADRRSAEADGDEVLEDQREREGRLLARWRKRAAKNDASPSAVLGFCGSFGPRVEDAFRVDARRGAAARSLAFALATRGDRSRLVPRKKRDALAAADARFRERRRRAAARFAAASSTDAAALVGLSEHVMKALPPRTAPPPRRPDGPSFAEALAPFDDTTLAPAALIEAIFEAFRRLTAAAGACSVGAEDCLGLAVLALVTDPRAPERPLSALYVSRVYGVRDPALIARDRDAEALYLVTTLDAAVAAVFQLGGEAGDAVSADASGDAVSAKASGDAVAVADSSETDDVATDDVATDAGDAGDAAGSADAGDAAGEAADAGDDAELDFVALAAEADGDADADADDAALRDLGSWLGAQEARESAVDLLRDEGWIS